ncbi:hypothetical protein [Magnetococcus sp. PR-3]|uniref:hypothetical protein n=1 Tax=Magnetococcus sp. PR-3 TaxID=3120355 RepID=UPI002FCE42C3
MTNAIDLHGARVYNRLSRPAAPPQHRANPTSDTRQDGGTGVNRDHITLSSNTARVTDAIDDLVEDTLDNMPGSWNARIEREALEQSMISLRLGTLYA